MRNLMLNELYQVAGAAPPPPPGDEQIEVRGTGPYAGGGFAGVTAARPTPGGGGGHGFGAWTSAAWGVLSNLFSSGQSTVTDPSAQIPEAVKACMQNGGSTATFTGSSGGLTIDGKVISGTGNSAVYQFSCHR